MPLDRAAWRDALRAVGSRCAATGIPVVAADLGADGFAAACADAGWECLSAGISPEDRAALTSDATRRFPTVAGHARIADLLGPALASRFAVRAR